MQVALSTIYYIKLKSRLSVCLSVRLHFLSRDNLGCLCMDRREIWFVYSCGFWHANAPLNNFLTVLCWAHERFKHTAVVVFAIIFGRVKYYNLCRFAWTFATETYYGSNESPFNEEQNDTNLESVAYLVAELWPFF